MVLGIPQTGLQSDRPNFVSYYSHRAHWESFLDNVLEFYQPNPTHFDKKSFSLSKLDRIFGTVVGSFAAKFIMRSDVATSPESLYYREISDHAPLILSISVRAKTAKQPRKTLPKHWTSGPVFQGRLNLLIAHIRPLELPISQQLTTIKSCIHEAALFTRDSLMFSDTGGREQKRLVLESMARAVWNNDCKLARVLLKVTTLAALHLQIVDGSVSCLDPPSFEEL